MAVSMDLAKTTMEEIHNLIQINEELISSKRKQIHQSMDENTTWWELYSYAAQSATTREEFNLVLGRLRETWLDLQYAKKNKLSLPTESH
jgi:hypothetical protein